MGNRRLRDVRVVALVIALACVLVFALGFVLARAIEPPRPVVVIARASDEWVELGGKYNLRERTSFSQRQVQALLDRCAAKDREIATLQDLLRAYRVDEHGSVERELRVIRGGE